jgi:hypothetical protein
LLAISNTTQANADLAARKNPGKHSRNNGGTCGFAEMSLLNLEVRLSL